jgi:hypothetical protein
VIAATETYSVALLLGVIPRVASFKLSPTTTLAEAEPSVKDRWDLGDLVIEFGLLDDDADIPAILPKSTVIGSLDLEKSMLIVRASGNIDSDDPVGWEPNGGRDDVENGIADDTGAADVRLMQSMKATIGSLEPGAMRCGFVCDDEVFHIRFPPGSKVGDARKAVAERFNAKQDAVALHFMGKALRDGFALSRLRLGTSHISVYLTKDCEVLI